MEIKRFGKKTPDENPQVAQDKQLQQGKNDLKAALSRYQSIQAAPNKHISHQHQLRALQLAAKYNDLDYKIYYLNLCKNIHPALIDQAESYVSDAQVDHKGKLFMWKIKQLKTEWKNSGKDSKNPDKNTSKISKKEKLPKKKKIKQETLF